MTAPLSPRVLAETIVGDAPWTDADGEAVARAYLELLAETEKAAWRGVYPQFCRDPEICRGMSHCPRDRSCDD